MEIPALEGQARGQNRSHGPGEFPSAQTQMGSTLKSLLAARNSNSALLLMNQNQHLVTCNQGRQSVVEKAGRKAAQAHGNAHLVGSLQRKDTVEGRDCAGRGQDWAVWTE